jgi:hypothetical protein
VRERADTYPDPARRARLQGPGHPLTGAANHGTTYLNAGLDTEVLGGAAQTGVSRPRHFSKDALKTALAQRPGASKANDAGRGADPV